MKRDHYNFIIIFVLFHLLSVELLYAVEKNNPTLNFSSFSFTYKKQILHCSPIKLIKNKSHKDMVKYSCTNIDTSHIANSNTLIKKEDRGRSETDRLLSQLDNNTNSIIGYSVNIPTTDASRPYMASFIAKQQIEDKFYGEMLRWILPARFYMSIRPQLTTTTLESKLKYRNGGTRGGFYYYYKFDSQVELITQYEANIRNKDEKAFIDFSDLSNSSRRLSYLSLKYQNYTLLYGKYWSAYYDIADFTDYFMTFGGQGSGVYNNGSDGSKSGTGRADNMLQLHTKLSDFKITLQYQFAHSGADNLDTNYRYGIASSLIYEGYDDFNFGMALSYAKFEEITPMMNTLGIDGEDSAAILGFEYKADKYGINANISYSKNHINDDKGIYFDSIGAEIYLHYDFTKNIRLAGGGNWIIPDDDNYQGDYSIKRGIISLQYTFGEATFDDLLYIEVSLPNGHLANGEKKDTSIAIGLRYLIDLH